MCKWRSLSILTFDSTEVYKAAWHSYDLNVVLAEMTLKILYKCFIYFSQLFAIAQWKRIVISKVNLKTFAYDNNDNAFKEEHIHEFIPHVPK